MKKMGNETITFRTNWEARFGLRTVPEFSKRVMDTEPLGKTCIRTKGRYSHLDIQDIREMRYQEPTMPRQGNIWWKMEDLQGRI